MPTQPAEISAATPASFNGTTGAQTTEAMEVKTKPNISTTTTIPTREGTGTTAVHRTADHRVAELRAEEPPSGAGSGLNNSNCGGNKDNNPGVGRRGTNGEEGLFSPMKISSRERMRMTQISQPELGLYTGLLKLRIT